MPVVRPEILRVSTEKDIILLIVTNFCISIWLLAIFESNAPICGENINIINGLEIQKAEHIKRVGVRWRFGRRAELINVQGKMVTVLMDYIVSNTLK